MAWEWGNATINTGQVIDWWFSWGDYPGLQVFQAKPVPVESGGLIFETPARLAVSDVSLERRIPSGWRYHLRVHFISGVSPVTYRIVGHRVD